MARILFSLAPGYRLYNTCSKPRCSPYISVRYTGSNVRSDVTGSRACSSSLRTRLFVRPVRTTTPSASRKYDKSLPPLFIHGSGGQGGKEDVGRVFRLTRISHRVRDAEPLPASGKPEVIADE